MKRAICAIAIVVTITIILTLTAKVGSYPKLDSCFKTSVSNKVLCSKSSSYVKLGDVSKYFLDAVVMSEDDKFYAHDGFDWKELKKSMEANLRQFAFVRGGSTITQQLVKNVYLSREKTISRKILEARLATRIEKEHSKKLILEKYVNAIEFGKNIWGIKQASNFYFKKSPGELNPLESLYLVILLPSPVKYSKTFFNKKLSSYQQKRMSSLLKRMKRRRLISPNQFDYLESELELFLSNLGVGDDMPPFESVEDSIDEDLDQEDAEVAPLKDTEVSDVESKLNAESLDRDRLDKESIEDQESLEIESEEASGEESYSEESTTVEDEDPDLAPDSGVETDEDKDID